MNDLCFYICDGLTPASSWASTQSLAYSLPTLSGMGKKIGRPGIRKLVGWNKVREITSHFSSLLLGPSVTPVTDVVSPQVAFSPFSDTTAGAGGQGQDVADSLFLSFLLACFLCSSMCPSQAAVSSGVYLPRHGLIPGLPSLLGVYLVLHGASRTHDFSVPPFPSSIPPTVLTFPKCFQRHHTLGCWAQLWPPVVPLWSWLEPGMSGTGQPLISSHRRHCCSLPLPKPCHLHPIQHIRTQHTYIFSLTLKAQSTSIHNVNKNLY